MKFIFSIIAFLLILYSIYLGTVLVRAGDVNFFNDVARDFLIYQEIDDKKIIFIGARSNTTGLFHGPLWHYLNYPAYLIGGGNPIVVAWFWIFLEVLFLLSSFFIVRKLFGILSAVVFVLLVSIRMALPISGVFQSEATFFFIPFFFFTIASYIKTRKVIYLAFHLFSLGVIIHMNIGTGLQFLLLVIPLVSYIVIKNKKWTHLFAFLMLPLALLNFILFDLRHNFQMTKALFSTGSATEFFVPIGLWIENRINNIISMQLLENSSNLVFLGFVFTLILIVTIVQIKKNSKLKQVLLLCMYYYFGYIAFSYFNKGILLFHYTYLLIPLTTLWFVAFLSKSYKPIFVKNENKVVFSILAAILFFSNVNHVQAHLKNRLTSFVGIHQNSWKGLSAVANDVITKQGGKEFGYYVFSPDAFAYQSRYAMIYHFRKAGAKASEYKKKPITYIIAAPPPVDDPFMDHVWWRKHSVNISSNPVEVKKFTNKFVVEKFNLTLEEQKIPHAKTIELGIHFR